MGDYTAFTFVAGRQVGKFRGVMRIFSGFHAYLASTYVKVFRIFWGGGGCYCVELGSCPVISCVAVLQLYFPGVFYVACDLCRKVWLIGHKFRAFNVDVLVNCP